MTCHWQIDWLVLSLRSRWSLVFDRHSPSALLSVPLSPCVSLWQPHYPSVRLWYFDGRVCVQICLPACPSFCVLIIPKVAQSCMCLHVCPRASVPFLLHALRNAYVCSCPSTCQSGFVLCQCVYTVCVHCVCIQRRKSVYNFGGT